MARAPSTSIMWVSRFNQTWACQIVPYVRIRSPREPQWSTDRSRSTEEVLYAIIPLSVSIPPIVFSLLSYKMGNLFASSGSLSIRLAVNWLWVFKTFDVDWRWWKDGSPLQTKNDGTLRASPARPKRNINNPLAIFPMMAWSDYQKKNVTVNLVRTLFHPHDFDCLYFVVKPQRKMRISLND